MNLQVDKRQDNKLAVLCCAGAGKPRQNKQSTLQKYQTSLTYSIMFLSLGCVATAKHVSAWWRVEAVTESKSHVSFGVARTEVELLLALLWWSWWLRIKLNWVKASSSGHPHLATGCVTRSCAGPVDPSALTAQPSSRARSAITINNAYMVPYGFKHYIYRQV